MNIHLIAIGKRMPSWINTGYEEYAKRLPRECALNLIEIDMPKRTKQNNIKSCLEREGKDMLAQIPEQSTVISLDVYGKSWSTEDLSEQLQHWMQLGKSVSLLIGGPDGLASTCIEKAPQSWSLSSLTLPHPLVRVIVAEQLYRAWTLLTGHPYHRG